jgi:ubiquitin carboxyl-terminal hydrolase 5/13
MDDLVRNASARLSVPLASESIFKDECAYSFTTALHPEGIFVNLLTRQAVAKIFLDKDYAKHQFPLYLNIKHTQFKKVKEQVKKLEIRVDQDEEIEVRKEFVLFVYPYAQVFKFPEQVVALPSGKLICEVIEAILQAQDSVLVEDAKAWQEEDRKVSKYAEHLEQLDNGKKISPDPKDWKCEDSGLQENLWLNLSTGYIGSGRRQADGSGGTGAALKHYQETGGIYPLAVKLGTITPHGADVYSYAPDEDDMVIDPFLAKHLAHWGINMMQMTKTEKSMEELQIDANMKLDFSTIMEEGKDLVPMSGPGFRGIVNIGNSCYINSVMQTLFALPEFKRRFADSDFMFSKAHANVNHDFLAQLSKLSKALYNADESFEDNQMQVDEESSGLTRVPYVTKISPRMLRVR